MITKIALIKKIRQIIQKHNNYEFISISTLAPAKEIADYVFKMIEKLKSDG